MLQTGQKIHVITRRLFPEDLRRHFVGEVKKCTDHSVLLQGYAFVFMQGMNKFMKKSMLRQRIFGLNDVGLIVTLLPADLNLEDLVYENVDNQMNLTDQKLFKLDIQEFAVNL